MSLPNTFRKWFSSVSKPIRNHWKKSRQAPKTIRLAVEALEDRYLATTLGNPLSSVVSVPQSHVGLHATTLNAIVSVPKSDIGLHAAVNVHDLTSLSRGIIDTIVWKEGLRPNHNETMVRARGARKMVRSNHG